MVSHRKPPKGETTKHIHEVADSYEFEDLVSAFEQCREKWSKLPNPDFPPKELSQFTFETLSAILTDYASKTNWQNSKPKKHIPANVALIIAYNIGYLLAGVVPGPIRCILRTGTPGVGPQENMHRGYAVAYMKACAAGDYEDSSPRKTVCHYYGITPRAASEWKNTHLTLSVVVPEHFFPDAKDAKERAVLLREAVEKCGPIYAQQAHGSVVRKSKQGASQTR